MKTAGHRFPSGEPARILSIRFEVKDKSGNQIFITEEKIERRVEGPGAREKYDNTLAPAERRMVSFEVSNDIQKTAHTAKIKVVFDRYGNLDALLDELAPLGLARETLIAEFDGLVEGKVGPITQLNAALLKTKRNEQQPMRILLVQPAPFEDRRLGLENTFWLSEPVGLTSIGTMVEDEHEVKILDMRLEEPAALPETLRNFRPDIVGTTAMTTDATKPKRS